MLNKSFFVFLSVSLISLSSNAALLVNCKAKSGNISAQLNFNGSSVAVKVSKNKNLVYSTQAYSTFNEKWNSITVDGTSQIQDQTAGVKIYFESARTQNEAAAIRPYGLTSQALYPGQEGIIVSGMVCNQSYQSIYNEVNNN